MAMLVLVGFFLTQYAAMFVYRSPLSAYGLPYAYTQNGKTPQDIVYYGEEYTYNEDITALLLLGIDATARRPGGASGDQADVLLLVAIDTKNGSAEFFSIPRDTITDIAHLDLSDRYAYSQKGEVAVSHSFGGLAGINDDLTMATVSNLLHHVPVTRYASLDIDGIIPLNDFFGGVELEMLEDFSIVHPDMKLGERFLLTGEYSERYVRDRQLPGMSGRDADRRVRQLQYFSQLLREANAYIGEKPLGIFDMLDVAGPYTQTNLRLSEMIYLLRVLKGSLPGGGGTPEIISIPGQYNGNAYIVDEDALTTLVLEHFFVRSE